MAASSRLYLVGICLRAAKVSVESFLSEKLQDKKEGSYKGHFFARTATEGLSPAKLHVSYLFEKRLYLSWVSFHFEVLVAF